MAKLELLLLGSPKIYVDGQAVTHFNTRKDQALLAYLAVTGTAHSRETLAGLLWSELPEDNARRNLRHTLSHLQKAIGPQWLSTERGVALTQEQPWSVDVYDLRTTLKNLTASSPVDTAHHGNQRLAALDRALNLYRGEFLQGFYLHEAVAFEEWVLAQREELRLLTLRGLEALVEGSLAQGAYEQGLAATRRLLQLEPWSEPAHCLHMKLLAQSGRRTEALAHYESCRKILVAELDVEPLPETTAIYQQIQAGKYNQAATPEPPTLPVALAQAQASASKPAVPHNLFTPLAGFVGRQSELDFICQRLAAPDCRLLTIIGPGGMGKSSLASAVGQRLLATQDADFPDGLFWVPLAEISAVEPAPNPPTATADANAGETILRAIAAQIGYKLEAGGSPALQLQVYLRTRQLLIIMDNFEHLLAGIEAVVSLLTHTPQVKMLITSRARLNVRGESVLTLDKLLLPTAAYHAAVAVAQANPAAAIPAEVWQASEAVAMFVQRAQQSDPAFTINGETIGPVGEICHWVDGLPLGIELATSMLPLLTCTQLAHELAKSLDFLAADTRDLPSEQRTLGAVFERSWRLLPPAGQRLLARLAIFPGSFRREAAECIAGASIALLRCLLDQSLLSKVGDERYVLHRTIHAFAQQKLQQRPEQSATLHVQYAHFYLAFLARLEQEQSEAAYADTLEQIQTDLDNVRTAWRWSVEQGNLALLELGVGSLQDFYQTAGIYPEALHLLEEALPTVRHAVALSPGAMQPRRLLARLLCYTAQFYRLYPQSGEANKGVVWANEALALGHRLDDPVLQGLASHELARIAQVRYDFATMRSLSEQAYRYGRMANLPQLTAESLNDVGIALSLATHPLAGIQHFHEALACLRQRPNRALEARLVSNLGLFYLAGHTYQAAYGYLQQRTLQPLFEDWVHLGDLLVALGAYSAAQQEYAQGLALAQIRHMPYWESWLHDSMGRLHLRRGEPAAAQSAGRLALQMAQKAGNHFIVQRARINLGHALAAQGDRVAAGHYYQQAIASSNQVYWFFHAADAHAGLAALDLAQNEGATAVPHAEAALALLAQHGLAAAGEPFAVYWTCVRVLQTADDPRAQTVLATAYQMLQETANQLEDEQLRRSFLENVVANRHLVAAAQAAGIVTEPVIHTPGYPHSASGVSTSAASGNT